MDDQPASQRDLKLFPLKDNILRPRFDAHNTARCGLSEQ